MAKTSDDMVLVPREPTEAMMAAPAGDRPGFSHGVAREVYRAMLAAAPAAQAAKPARLTDEQIKEQTK